MRLALALLAGCGGAPQLLEFVEAAPDLVRPIQLTGNSRHELWSVAEPGDIVAHTRDGGATWRRYPAPKIRAPLQLTADNKHRAWIVGTGLTGEPALASITYNGTAMAITEDFSDVFPPGTSNVTMHSGGWDPDPMITARVPGSPNLTMFLLREQRFASWIQHPTTDVVSLVGIYGTDSGYFVTDEAGVETLVHCTLPDDAAHCFSVPPWADDNTAILPSTPTPANDWLWHPDSSGGLLLRRMGPEFETRRIEGWPGGSLVPVRFFAMETGELGVLAARGSVLVWVALDVATRVTHETPLGECDCELDPAAITILPDDVIVIPTANGWYLADVRGI